MGEAVLHDGPNSCLRLLGLVDIGWLASTFSAVPRRGMGRLWPERRLMPTHGAPTDWNLTGEQNEYRCAAIVKYVYHWRCMRGSRQRVDGIPLCSQHAKYGATVPYHWEHSRNDLGIILCEPAIPFRKVRACDGIASSRGLCARCYAAMRSGKIPRARWQDCDRDCLQCGQTFVARKDAHRYCSESCGQKHYKQLKRASVRRLP